MYKHVSRNLQHAHGVIKVRPSLRVEDDLIATAGNMSMSECRAERAQIAVEMARAQNELIVAKANKDDATKELIGLRIASLCARNIPLNERIKELAKQSNSEAVSLAVKELCDEELRKAIFARAREITEAMP